MKSKEGREPSYSTAEAAELLSIPAPMIREMVREGSLPGWADGGRCRVSARAVDARVAKRAAEAAAALAAAVDAEDVEPDSTSVDSDQPTTAAIAPRAPRSPFIDDVEDVLGELPWLMSVAQTAAVLHMSRSTIDAAIALGQLPTRQIGQRYYVSLLELDAWLARRNAA